MDEQFYKWLNNEPDKKEYSDTYEYFDWLTSKYIEYASNL